MNRLNRILHNKRPKILYFIESFARMAWPKRWLRRKLDRVLAEVERRPDYDYIMQRVEYYNKLMPMETPAGLRPLGSHKFGDMGSAYFFDTYEFTRWFDDALLWNAVPGDVIEVPEVPSIVKSRPIAGDNANSVVLNLDKERHFVFLRDDIPFREKENRSIFRVSMNVTFANHIIRKRFMEMYFGSEICDAGISNRPAGIPPEWTKPFISMYDHLRYKFILTIEGNDVATNLKWVMSTNSLAVMPRPRYETWYMEGRLIPDYHYVEIRPDYTDLAERMQYYIDHPDEAEAIIRHAHEWTEQFRDRERERIISLMVLRRYFERTGQI